MFVAVIAALGSLIAITATSILVRTGAVHVVAGGASWGAGDDIARLGCIAAAFTEKLVLTFYFVFFVWTIASWDLGFDAGAGWRGGRDSAVARPGTFAASSRGFGTGSRPWVVYLERHCFQGSNAFFFFFGFDIEPVWSTMYCFCLALGSSHTKSFVRGSAIHR